MQEVRTDIEFQCPNCGSSCYGSSGHGSDMVGYCHGDYCKFSWNRAKDDYTVFTLVTRQKFSSPTEYLDAFGRYICGEQAAIGVRHANQDSPPG